MGRAPLPRTMNIEKFFEESLRQSAEVKQKTIEVCCTDVLKAVDLIVDAYRAGHKLLFCGNGGSAADCQHLATELMIRLNHDITRPALGAISLCTDASNLTAAGNDIGFENVFARNVEGLGQPGDVLVAISTSGRSPNIIKAIEAARQRGMAVVGLSGGNGGRMRDICNVAIIVPSENTQRIQETHITLGHIICESVEQLLYGASS